MNKKKSEHIGSSFDDFLKEEGMLEEIEKAVAKRILELKKQGIDKAERPPKVETSRSAGN